MDVIQQVFSLAPVPYLAPAFSVLRFIYSSVQQVQDSKQQLIALTQAIAQLLGTIDAESKAGRMIESKQSATALKNLTK